MGDGPCDMYRNEYTVHVAAKRTLTKKAAAKKAQHEETKIQKKPPLECRFFVTEAGNEPVRDWLKGLDADVRKEVGSDIQLAQWRWPIGKPLVDGFGEGLFEVRTSFDHDIYRVLFCLDGSTMVLLHGFEKKAQKTPKRDLDLARKRQKKVKEDP
jgi:phage-related protein